MLGLDDRRDDQIHLTQGTCECAARPQLPPTFLLQLDEPAKIHGTVEFTFLDSHEVTPRSRICCSSVTPSMGQRCRSNSARHLHFPIEPSLCAQSARRTIPEVRPGRAGFNDFHVNFVRLPSNVRAFSLPTCSPEFIPRSTFACCRAHRIKPARLHFENKNPTPRPSGPSPYES